MEVMNALMVSPAFAVLGMRTERMASCSQAASQMFTAAYKSSGPHLPAATCDAAARRQIHRPDQSVCRARQSLRLPAATALIVTKSPEPAHNRPSSGREDPE